MVGVHATSGNFGHNILGITQIQPGNTWQLMAACGRVEPRNKNAKFIAADLDSNNLYIAPKNTRKRGRQQMIKGSEWSRNVVRTTLYCCVFEQ
jgi:hypothetical protein